MTRLHINAILALNVLLLMFGATYIAFRYVVENAETLSCTTTEFGLALIGLMMASVGGVVYVVKQFATRSYAGTMPDENGEE